MEEENSKDLISGVIHEGGQFFSDFLRNTFKRVSHELHTQTQPCNTESDKTMPLEDFLQNGISPPDMKTIYI